MQDWRDPVWRDRAVEWVRHELADRGITVTGEIEQPHVYFWSTALRIPTDDGVMWFKAAHPDGVFEARLTPYLAALRPDVIVDVVVADADRGWLLTRHAGTRLRDAEPFSVDRWCAILATCAQLQVELAGREAELLSLGVPDRRPAALPGLVRGALASPTLADGGPAALGAVTRSDVERALPLLDELCVRLDGSAVPASLQHDDLHDGNVFVDGERTTLLDWGDASVTHPFHTLTVTTRSLAHRYSLTPGGEEVGRLVEAYLEPWTAVAPRATLLADLDAARRTGPVQRALAWLALIEQMPPDVAATEGDAVPYGLRLFTLDAPYGAWDDGTC